MEDPISTPTDLIISKSHRRSIEKIGLQNKSCECYMHVSIHFLFASYYFIKRFCKLLENMDNAVLMSSVHTFLVGSSVNRAEDFKVIMQRLCPEYVVGTQHDAFLFILHVISKLDEEILKNCNEEKSISKHFTIVAKARLVCK